MGGIIINNKNMKLNNCLICCCHRDNKEEKCNNKRHIFNISKKQAERYNRDISYIKDELLSDRHIIACLGSAGYTFLDDIEKLANYAYAIGDREFYNILETEISKIDDDENKEPDYDIDLRMHDGQEK